MSEMIERSYPRRGFLGRLAALGAVLGVGALGAAPAQGYGARPAVLERGDEPEEAWLRGLTGKHRQVFEATGKETGAFGMANNYLNAYNNAYGLVDAEVNALIVVHGYASAFVFADEAWRRYKFSKQFEISWREAKGKNARNVVAPMIEKLQGRGVVVVLCNNVLKGMAAMFAEETKRTSDEVYEELHALLLPGVQVVPAAVLAVNRAQEEGFTYLYAG